MVNLSPGKRLVAPPSEVVDPVVVPWTAPVAPHELLRGLRGQRHPALLDSAADHGGQGGWSFLTFDPVRTLTVPAWRPRAETPLPLGPDPFSDAGALLEARPAWVHPEIPFTGGVIGCWGYDLRFRLEALSCRASEDILLPDAWIGLYDTLYAFDTRSRLGYLVRTPAPGETAADAADRVARFRRILERAATAPPWAATLRPAAPRSNFTRDGYRAAVRRVKEYIAAGDIYQANLSQRFSTPLPASPVEIYPRLRAASPAPYSTYVDAGSFQALSASPECFLRIRGREITTRPIKGTRARGGTPEADARLACELLASEKDRAELVMIVDLERNDLGRMCEYGTVRVPCLGELESHPTVHHRVATVTGRLREGVRALAALRACFPGGSITGAPKIRAMEVIDELEPHARGFYTGAIGYAGFDGCAEWNIAIRTMIAAGGAVTFSAGGAIVGDSDPDAEFEETLHKSRAMFRALGAG
jgi:para-aminobenzoate synthetase component 1